MVAGGACRERQLIKREPLGFPRLRVVRPEGDLSLRVSCRFDKPTWNDVFFCLPARSFAAEHTNLSHASRIEVKKQSGTALPNAGVYPVLWQVCGTELWKCPALQLIATAATSIYAKCLLFSNAFFFGGCKGGSRGCAEFCVNVRSSRLRGPNEQRQRGQPDQRPSGKLQGA
jgi:hypothetical protein